MSKDESKRSSSSSKADKASKKRKKEGAIKEEAPAVVEAAAEVAVAAAEAAVEDDKPAKESKKEKKDKKDKDKKRKAEAEADPVGEPVEGAADAVEEDGESEKAPVNEEIPELDEAPVSRKEARKAKRRKVAKDEDGESEDESSPAKAEASKAPRSTHGVWIGNLNFQTTKEALLSWLRAQGLEDDPVRVNMPGGKKKTEKNRGFVYVDFATPEEMHKAIGASEGHLEGRRLLIKSSTDFGGRPGATGAGSAAALIAPTHSKTERRILNIQKHTPGPTLFVGNLGFETTEGDIREMFEVHQRAKAAWDRKEKKRISKKRKRDSGAEADGSDSDSDDSDDDSSDSSDSESEEEGDAATTKAAKGERKEKVRGAGIRSMQVGTFEDTGRCKGWAFVTFYMAEQATRALINPRNHHLAGRKLVLEYASPDAARRHAPKAVAPSSGGGGGGGNERASRGSKMDPMEKKLRGVKSKRGRAAIIGMSRSHGRSMGLRHDEGEQAETTPSFAGSKKVFGDD